MPSDRVPQQNPGEGSGRLPGDVLEGDDLELQRYIEILRRRWPWIVSVTAIVLAATLVYTLNQPRVYRATATVEISFGDPSLLNPNDPWGAYQQHQYFLETQYQLIRSRTIARMALEDLGWLDRPDWREMENPAGAFAGGISVQPSENSYIVQVSYDAREPEVCKEAANALVGAYIRYTEERRESSSLEAERSIDEQLPAVRERLEESERELREFVERTNILSFSTQEQILVRRVNELDSDLNEVRSERIRLQSRLDEVESALEEGASPGDIAAIVESRTLESLKTERQDLTQEREELSVRFRSDHPRIRALDARLDELRAEMGREVRQIAEGLRSRYEQKEREEEELSRVLERNREELQDLYALQGEYESLQQTVEQDRRIYDELVERQKRQSAFTRVDLNNVAIVDEAEEPKAPIYPNRRRNAVLGLVMGLFAGLGLAFLIDLLDDQVRSVEEVESILGVPSVGALTTADDEEEIHLCVDRRPNSIMAEAFRTIRAHVLFASGDEPPHVILMTSSGPMEGKTTITSNLAAALALGGDRVLLIDADLRRSRLHKIFEMERAPGAKEFLEGEVDLQAAVRHTDVEGLDFLPGGGNTDRSSELLNTGRLAELVRVARAAYDRVVIDTPPAEPVADARLLAREVDRAFLVVSMARASRRQVDRTAKELEQVGAPLAGCVINHVDQSRSNYYRKPYYYYAGVPEEGGA